MTIGYDVDIVGWANEQARLIRAGRFDLLDLEHIADEIEDVGKSEQRELFNRMAGLLMRLLKWQYQPERRGNSWRRTIKEQRKQIDRCLFTTPSHKARLSDAAWWESVWSEAVANAALETGPSDFPEVCSWSLDEVLGDWLPD